MNNYIFGSGHRASAASFIVLTETDGIWLETWNHSWNPGTGSSYQNAEKELSFKRGSTFSKAVLLG